MQLYAGNSLDILIYYMISVVITPDWYHYYYFKLFSSSLGYTCSCVVIQYLGSFLYYYLLYRKNNYQKVFINMVFTFQVLFICWFVARERGGRGGGGRGGLLFSSLLSYLLYLLFTSVTTQLSLAACMYVCMYIPFSVYTNRFYGIYLPYVILCKNNLQF